MNQIIQWPGSRAFEEMKKEAMKEAARAAMLGKHLSPETREKLRQANLGRPSKRHTPETRKKISETLKQLWARRKGLA